MRPNNFQDPKIYVSQAFICKTKHLDSREIIECNLNSKTFFPRVKMTSCVLSKHSK